MLAITRQLVQEHALPQILQELQNYWADEQNRRNEFYNWVRDDQKVEFIDGEIVVHSPVRLKHYAVTANLTDLLRTYVRKNGGLVGVEKLMCRFTRNDYEPDICYFDAIQTATFKDEQTIFPVPCFIVEILSKSTEHRDRGVKLTDYEAHGVQEYWIIDADTEKVEQYILENNIYNKKELSEAEILEFSIFKGLKMPIRALFDATIFEQTLEMWRNFP
jgi:Uma2 family endonuclease